MMNKHKELEAIVNEVFATLNRQKEITHGIEIEIVSLAGQTLFEVRGPSGGVCSEWFYYLKATAPANCPKHLAITNAVQVRPIDNRSIILDIMAREMCRLQGFAAAGPAPNGEPDTQPRITNLDGGDMGIPWKANQTSHEAYLAANPGVAKQLEKATLILHRMNEETAAPLVANPRFHARITNIEMPEGYRGERQGDSMPDEYRGLIRRYPCAGHRDREGAGKPASKLRMPEGYWKDRTKPKELEVKPGPRIDFNNSCTPQPEPSAGLAPEVKHCECGAQRGQLHFHYCPMWKEPGCRLPKHCECGAQRGELHFQYCPMWEETHATETD